MQKTKQSHPPSRTTIEKNKSSVEHCLILIAARLIDCITHHALCWQTVLTSTSLAWVMRWDGELSAAKPRRVNSEHVLHRTELPTVINNFDTAAPVSPLWQTGHRRRPHLTYLEIKMLHKCSEPLSRWKERDVPPHDSVLALRAAGHFTSSQASLSFSWRVQTFGTVLKECASR